ncbi:hypothetical protein LWI29_003239 [Acer saccharum]|uniref:Uncharacterized protein n=1 Tax=Acer saccharum TaxID=4024 RepID=A0AA39UPH9_ACESA|nr:hypothetical protein LWI29_003239 [Acer saccharum]KAK1552770.1 hypothetical protein Q3G72_023217 [Acer saccharum]
MALDLKQDVGKENIVSEVKKASWNLKEERAKIIKVGVVLSFDFNGREKVMVDEIVRRIKAGSFAAALFFFSTSHPDLRLSSRHAGGAHLLLTLLLLFFHLLRCISSSSCCCLHRSTVHAATLLRVAVVETLESRFFCL